MTMPISYAAIEKAVLAKQEGFVHIRKEAEKLWKEQPPAACLALAQHFYTKQEPLLQMLAVFLYGFLAASHPPVLNFLRSEVSGNPDWRVQEILAMAFDQFCKDIGYENALPTIAQWLNASTPNTRRAVTEGLRIWTRRPFFKEHPQQAIELLSAYKTDESDYVRRSVGNALRDIGKKHPELLGKELSAWDLKDERQTQVYKLATKNKSKI